MQILSSSPLVRRSLQTILVADDSMTERANLARILRGAGYEVLMAASGNEAFELAVRHEPDAVFLDILMEDGDGYRTCRELKRHETTADIPVIMVSSKANPVDRQWAMKLGASAYVVKPYADTDILEPLARL
ncbi:MAG TPA: response regulator [Thiolinea sp.]|nr:response regulator [Thiolinea sp.]